MNNVPKPSKLDEALLGVFFIGQDYVQDKATSPAVTTKLTEARLEVLALIEEVIGSDEEPGSMVSSNPDEAFGPGYRNRLRAEMRLRKDNL